MKIKNYLAYLAGAVLFMILFTSFESEFDLGNASYIDLSAESMYLSYTNSYSERRQSSNLFVSGDSSPIIYKYKRVLYYLGYLEEADGDYYDEEFQEALSKYQGDAGLESTGLLGIATMRRLDLEKPPYVKGQKGREILRCQQTLAKLGYLDPAKDLDGLFDNETLIAVIKYQHFNSLEEVGEIDFKTQLSLLKKTSEQVPFTK
ncbi:MAG: peptidoglycan-binding protein [Eubacteriaceae bacterium]|nr:peptidoglycan-binding protein [Eubacteriaceae bacterium]